MDTFDDQFYELKHHFLEGNLPIGSECYVCGESFELLTFNRGLRCSRCEKMVFREIREYVINKDSRTMHGFHASSLQTTSRTSLVHSPQIVAKI
jgi:DNA-directed RNA polymerase subunit RPC12/RpoP